MRGTTAPVPFDCGNSDESWAQVYLYAIDHMNGGAVGIGSDFNGLAGEPAPRFGPDACDGDRSDPYNPARRHLVSVHAVRRRSRRSDSSTSARAPSTTTTTGSRTSASIRTSSPTCDQIGLSNQDLNPLFHSAEAYVRMWERSEDVTPPDVSCSTPTAGWSAANIVVSCTASDYPSDLMNGRRRLVHARDERCGGIGDDAAATVVAVCLRQAEQLRDRSGRSPV